jgi:hypothetical protein
VDDVDALLAAEAGKLAPQREHAVQVAGQRPHAAGATHREEVERANRDLALGGDPRERAVSGARKQHVEAAGAQLFQREQCDPLGSAEAIGARMEASGVLEAEDRRPAHAHRAACRVRGVEARKRPNAGWRTGVGSASPASEPTGVGRFAG